jgi:hypothetical protein
MPVCRVSQVAEQPVKIKVVGEQIDCNFEVDIAEFIAFQEFIFGQDIEILQHQKPEEPPLDLQAELHLKSDRMSIAYRKYLVSLGVSWGFTW